MCHTHRQPIGNPDDLPETSPHRVIPSWPGLQRHRTTSRQHQLRELPASNPAELATDHTPYPDTVDSRVGGNATETARAEEFAVDADGEIDLGPV